jgi:hypothetical protein
MAYRLQSIQNDENDSFEQLIDEFKKAIKVERN